MDLPRLIKRTDIRKLSVARAHCILLQRVLIFKIQSLALGNRIILLRIQTNLKFILQFLNSENIVSYSRNDT